MNEKLKILDDFCFDLGVGYGVRFNLLFVYRSNDLFLIKRIKSKAKELGIGYRTKKDYIDFFVK